MKPKEDPSFTKKHGGHDVRKNHPGGGNADYAKNTKDHPFLNTGPGAGYKNVGKASKQGGDDPRKSHPAGGENVNYGNFDKKHPHQGK